MSEYSFWDRENSCQLQFSRGGPYCMLTSPGMDFLLFANEEEMVVASNLIAIALSRCPVRLLHYVVMNNHMHLLAEGPTEAVKQLELKLVALFRRFQKTRGYNLRADWGFHELWIVDLSMFRKIVAYISRNPYVASRDATPTGFLWSGGYLFFNKTRRLLVSGIEFPALSYREKRQICRSHDIELPKRYRVHQGVILPESFVDYAYTESFFNSANQYFTYLYRQGEADVEIARMVGESMLLPNDEVFSIVSSWYQVKSTKMLDMNQRLDAAKRMRHELGSNARQISQILRLPISQIEQMFPSPK